MEEIRELLKQKLPEYMVPSSFSMLERLPLTPQGKVDRRTLQTMPLAATERKRRFVPPADSTQLLIAQVWEELLGVKPIGIRDNFFELGGHSLLAISMLDRMERLFGRKIPVAALFAEPTIQTLSLALWNAERNEAVSPLVEVQRGANRRPFFFLHGDFNGGGFYCHNPRGTSAPTSPSTRSIPTAWPGREIPATIEAMAAEYLELVPARQPEGPYLLGGHCNGALVAFEMARRLHAAGQKVDLLVMLAPPTRRRIGFSSVMNVGLRQLMPCCSRCRQAAFSNAGSRTFVALPCSGSTMPPAGLTSPGRTRVPWPSCLRRRKFVRRPTLRWAGGTWPATSRST